MHTMACGVQVGHTHPAQHVRQLLPAGVPLQLPPEVLPLDMLPAPASSPH